MSVEEMHRRMQGMTTGPEGGQISAKDELEKKVNPIPRGFRTVTPYLIAENGPALIEFAKQAFGAEEMFRAVGSAGGLHGEVRIGDSMLMMGGGIPGREFRATPNTHALHIYVEDADAVYKKALAAGATLIDEPRDQEYGERSASVKDPAGNYWYIATHKGGSYVPKGLNNVNVYMHPLRAEPVIAFLKRAFGAREIAKYASPDGVVHHAEIRVGDSVWRWVSRRGNIRRCQPCSTCTFQIAMPCTARHWRRAGIDFGTRRPALWRSKRGSEGCVWNTWCIATHVKDVTE